MASICFNELNDLIYNYNLTAQFNLAAQVVLRGAQRTDDQLLYRHVPQPGSEILFVALWFKKFYCLLNQ